MNLPLGMFLLLSMLHYIMIHFIIMLNVMLPVSFQIILSLKVEATADVPVSHKCGSSWKKTLPLNLSLSEEEKSEILLKIAFF